MTFHKRRFLAFGLQKVRERPRPGVRASFLTGRFHASHKAVGQVEIAHVVGGEVPLGEQVGADGGGDDEFKHGGGGAWRYGP